MSAHVVNYTVPKEACLKKKPIIFNVKGDNKKFGTFKVSTAGIFWKPNRGKKPSWKKWSWERFDKIINGGSQPRKNYPKKIKRVPNPAFMKPMTPSADLAKVVGNKPIPRTQITKKLWEYIKKHGLQDKNQKTMINADAKLKKVFRGKSQVSMFEMTKLISKHLT